MLAVTQTEAQTVAYLNMVLKPTISCVTFSWNKLMGKTHLTACVITIKLSLRLTFILLTESLVSAARQQFLKGEDGRHLPAGFDTPGTNLFKI